MHPFTEALITIGSLIIGIAALALILSPKANTTGVIQATASGFSNALGTAMSPVTGAQINYTTAYPQQGGMPSFGSNPQLN
jgi:hypothetical protein